ncbi:MAG: chromosome segregation protein SMC [Pseudomonadota bacterium]
MRLSKIKLAGFKSFVDPTTINLPGNLISILGPNGCGKSNTIDAVRWVMGESSAKSLRGESMTDVIFNGSSSRKPVGQAMVELIFDNSDAKLGGQYANFNEVSIKRTVNRDSQSFYYLNNTRCRRKDVTDLFLGTGLGPRSYSIIEQGTISKLIESKPEELRVYIEEAAGISKYKERRRETENRIRHTRENLERLEDIRNELEKQLSRLQRQARTANKFKQLKHTERQVKAQLNALQWRNIDNQSYQQQLIISTTETEFEKKTSELRQLELSIEQTRELHHTANEDFNQIQGEFYQVGSQIARLEQSIEHAQERQKQNQDDFSEATAAYEQALQHLNVDNDKINQIKVQIHQLEPQLEQYQQQAQISQEQLHNCEQLMQEWQLQWDDFNFTAQEPGQIAQVERSKINQLELQIQRLKQKITKLELELEQHSVDQLEINLEELQMQQQGVEQIITELAQLLEQQKYQSNDSFEKVKTCNDELNQAKNVLSTLNGKKSSLDALQAAALGKDSERTNDWLNEKQLSKNERLAQYLTVTPGWENSVEFLLGDLLEAVCIDGEKFQLSTADLANFESPGFPLTLLDLDSLQQIDDVDQNDTLQNFSLLADFVQANQSISYTLKHVLRNIVAVDTLQQAINLLPDLKKDFSIICRDGFYLGHNWLKVMHGSDENTGVLVREKILKKLDSELEEITLLIDHKEQLLDSLRILQIDAESSKEQSQNELNQQNKQLAEIKNQLNNKQLRIEHLTNRQKQIKTERQENQQQISSAYDEINIATDILHQALEDIDILAEQKQQLQLQREEYQQQLQDFKETYRQDKEQSHSLEIRVNALNSELNATEQALARVNLQLQGLQNRCNQLNDLIVTESNPVQSLEVELESFLSNKISIDENLSQARNALDNLDQQVRLFESQRVGLEQVLETIRDELEEARIHWQELKVKRQTQQENIDESSFILSELLLQIPENAKESDWQDELKQLNKNIQSLGSINLAAIDEYQEQQQRKDYLDAQNSDLVDALSTLEGAIAKIDRETRTRFKTTFEKINTELKLLFPRLFGGGHAYLDLTGDDFLNTGVTIMARPPGKRNSTIHLLSGGEKAMTAVALVFAIFSLNPAPFCMLDEVDAPLDEANVGRFCKMVKEMSKQVQFVYITHNKTTMEMSDYLCGVTMKEAGVSRVVDVDIHEAAEMVES